MIYSARLRALHPDKTVEIVPGERAAPRRRAARRDEGPQEGLQLSLLP